MLRLHGVRTAACPAAAAVAAFEVAARAAGTVPSQGVGSGGAFAEVTLAGDWCPPEPLAPLGAVARAAVFGPAAQPLAMLAAQLLEPLSEDSLFTYGVLAVTEDGDCPVLRVEAVAEDDGGGGGGGGGEAARL